MFVFVTAIDLAYRVTCRRVRDQNTYCSISFNSYGHASHSQKPTKIFVSHPVKEAILGLAELAELSRALPVDQIP
jgi:hypothetical protein